MKKLPESRCWQLGPDLSVITRNTRLAEDLTRLFSCLETPATPAGEQHVLDFRHEDAGRYQLLWDGSPVAGASSESDRILLLETLLTHAAAHVSHTCAVFHAGALARDGRALLLPGERGTGKTTSSLWLAQHGFSYLGDDLALVRYEDCAVVPFAKAATVKRGSFDFFTAADTVEDAVRGPVRYHLPETAVSVTADPLPLQQLIFPVYEAAASLKVERVPPELCALALVQQVYGGVDRQPAKMKFVAGLSALPAHQVTFSRLEDLESAVTELWGGVS